MHMPDCRISYFESPVKSPARPYVLDIDAAYDYIFYNTPSGERFRACVSGQ